MHRFWFWLLSFFLCAPAFAMFNAEVRDGAVQPDGVGHVEAGAVQAPVTGTINSDVQPGAVQATGTVTANTTFQQPLATIRAPLTIDAPVKVEKGFEVNLFPRAVSFNVDENAVPVTVNLKLDMGPAAEKICAMLKPAQDVACDVAAVTSHWRLFAEGAGGLALALAVGWLMHAHGNRKVIRELKNGNVA
jgi:hypothetical protein